MRKAYLEVVDILKMEMAAANPRDRLLIRLLFRLGCRVSEGLSITTDNIDFEHARLTIPHLKKRLNLTCPQCSARISKSHGFCPGCGDKLDEAVVRSQEFRRQRELPIDPETVAMLAEYITNIGQLTENEGGRIFTISRHRAWQIVSDCAERAGLPRIVNPESGKVHNVSPHRMRDVFAVHAMKQDDSGDGMRMLQEHLGHASFNTTARYRKISGSEHFQWYQRLWTQGEKTDSMEESNE